MAIEELKIMPQKEKKASPKQSVSWGFLSGLKYEAKRITWPTKKELYSSTKIVLIMTFTFGLAIYLVDIFIRTGLQGLDTVFYWLTGR